MLVQVAAATFPIRETKNCRFFVIGNNAVTLDAPHHHVMQRTGHVQSCSSRHWCSQLRVPSSLRIGVVSEK